MSEFQYGEEVNSSGTITHPGSWGTKSKSKAALTQIIIDLRVLMDEPTAGTTAALALKLNITSLPSTINGVGIGGSATGVTIYDNTKIARSGDTMTGLLVLSGDPTNGLGAVTKQYADSVNTTGNAATSTVSLSCTGNASTATKLATARKINGVNFDGASDITVYDSTKLSLGGGLLTGSLGVMGGVNIDRISSTDIIHCPSSSSNMLLGAGSDMYLCGNSYLDSNGNIRFQNSNTKASRIRLSNGNPYFGYSTNTPTKDSIIVWNETQIANGFNSGFATVTMPTVVNIDDVNQGSGCFSVTPSTTGTKPPGLTYGSLLVQSSGTVTKTEIVINNIDSTTFFIRVLLNSVWYPWKTVTMS